MSDKKPFTIITDAYNDAHDSGEAKAVAHERETVLDRALDVRMDEVAKIYKLGRYEEKPVAKETAVVSASEKGSNQTEQEPQNDIDAVYGDSDVRSETRQHHLDVADALRAVEDAFGYEEAA